MLTVQLCNAHASADFIKTAAAQVMYIPNHCSYFDILTLSGFLPRPFKYISKIEVLRIPMIGWAMRMAHHIAIRRNDRKSQVHSTTITCTDTASNIADIDMSVY
jgi:1-acyl-sn-glycerol-3-phosphate acyltransferase